MAAPTPYVPGYDFTDYQSVHPTDPLPADHVDTELGSIAASISTVCAAINNVRRSDGALVNGIVTVDSLSTAVLALIGKFKPRGNWATATAYAVNDFVTQNNIPYLCIVAHTSGTFATDLAAHKWQALGPNAIAVDGSSTVTADIPFGGHKLTGVASGVAGTDAVNVTQATSLASTAAGVAIAAIPASAEATAGLIKLATDAQAQAGADDTTAMTPHDMRIANVDALIVPVVNEVVAVSTGTSKRVFRMPFAFTLTAVRASLKTAQTSGSILTVDINANGTSVISTKLTIDNTEKTSTTAATPAVISTSSVADDAEITFDVDQIGDGTAAGLVVELIGYRT